MKINPHNYSHVIDELKGIVPKKPENKRDIKENKKETDEWLGWLMDNKFSRDIRRKTWKREIR